jgi:type II secretory ATPase GspE/PulE/Tfp pilus assembly ATPase PilB-like protein
MSGRVGLHELMSVTPALRRMIQVNARAEDLVTEAFRSGQFRTLRQDGILKVLAGLTSMDEVRANSNA